MGNVMCMYYQFDFNFLFQTDADDKPMATDSQIPSVPELPKGPITDNTVDCVNVSTCFF